MRHCNLTKVCLSRGLQGTVKIEGKPQAGKTSKILKMVNPLIKCWQPTFL